jgi:DNA-nicking Smr family endonuclease
MDAYHSTLFVTLEYDKNLPSLDLHGIGPEDVEREVINFISKQIRLGQSKVQIIYGRGGKGILREKTKQFLDKNKAEINQDIKLVKAWKEASLADAGGRCLVILEE